MRGARPGPCRARPGTAAEQAASLRRRAGRRRAGQSLIESCLVIALICLIFLGLFHVSQLLAAREVLSHAAARGARAKTVGFRSWMVDKAVLVASIPNAGRMEEPAFDNQDTYLRDALARLRPGELWDELLGAETSSLQYNIERARIPEFMAAQDWSQARYILDYAEWDTVHTPLDLPVDPAQTDSIIEMNVFQDVPLWVPGRIHRAFYADESVRLRGEATIENHFPLYIQPDERYY